MESKRECGEQGYYCYFFLGHELEHRFTKNHRVIFSVRQWFMQFAFGGISEKPDSHFTCLLKVGTV